MSSSDSAQGLRDDLATLLAKHKDTPGVAYHLAALEGILGHLEATISQQANAPVPTVEPTSAAAEPPAPVKPAPAVQVAKPKPTVN
jgi:hypothetical protein